MNRLLSSSLYAACAVLLSVAVPAAAAPWKHPVTFESDMEETDGNAQSFAISSLYDQPHLPSGDSVFVLDKQKAAALRKKAEQGNADAQYRLGVLYYAPKSSQPKQDVREAAKWVERAARQNHTDAQHLFGVMLLNGQGVQANPEEARRWLRKSMAKGGNLAGQSALHIGLSYLDEENVAADPALETVLRRHLDDTHYYRPTQYVYGLMLLHGKGVKRNDGRGRYWVCASIANGYTQPPSFPSCPKKSSPNPHR